ncbi:MAG: S41 family peptidase, partial [Defluviitaleaceae bacterium]|nr:S41 family peptidase [Defluviitaleaceae bacterium]
MFRRKRGKRLRSVAEKYLRFKIISLSSIAILLGGVFALVFVNYDYMQFRLLIAGNYIHTDTLDEMFETHLGFAPDNYGRYFDNLVIAVMTQEIRRVGGDRFTYQYTPAMRHAQRDRVISQAQQAEFREIAPGVAYLWLPNISPLVEDFVMDNKAELTNFDNLVLDLRGNGGGNLSVSQAISGLFVERRTVVGIDYA